MSLSIGVLMIGSLYWDEVRAGWRADRFEKDVEFLVEAPIRYGRLSNSQTYTMVFSRSVPEMGTAKVLKCTRAIEGSDNLITEAEHLWAAERRQNQSDGRISSSWGCVGLLVSPTTAIPNDLLEGWARRVSRDRIYNQFQHTGLDWPIVNASGVLHIDWPRLKDSNELLPLDLLLATANEPTYEGDPRSYPSVETIALAWKRSTEERPQDKHESYFWDNRKAQITTFQDKAIERILRQGSGCLSLLF